MAKGPKKQTVALLSVVTGFMIVVSFALRIFLNGVEPWPWIALGLEGAAAVIVVVLLVRLVRGQRDDFWRERGKDPKHPDA
jgi:hypothetical protein